MSYAMPQIKCELNKGERHAFESQDIDLEYPLDNIHHSFELLGRANLCSY